MTKQILIDRNAHCIVLTFAYFMVGKLVDFGRNRHKNHRITHYLNYTAASRRYFGSQISILNFTCCILGINRQAGQVCQRSDRSHIVNRSCKRPVDHHWRIVRKIFEAILVNSCTAKRIFAGNHNIRHIWCSLYYVYE